MTPPTPRRGPRAGSAKRRGHVAVLAMLALSGCGSSGHRPRTESRVEQDESACGTLFARLKGIEKTEAMDDPQLATLEGRLPAARTARASEEAIAVSRGSAAELRLIHAPAASLHAIEVAEPAYAGYARSLRTVRARDSSAGLRMESGYMRLVGREVLGCVRPLRTG